MEYKKICKECGIKCNKKNKDFLFNIPIKCKIEGLFFLKRENIKQKIRKQKEECLLLKIKLIKTTNTKQKDKINNKINKINKEIDKFSDYGSKDW